MSVTAVGLTSGPPTVTPSKSTESPGFVGSFATLLANEMPDLQGLDVSRFDWVRYGRAVFDSDEAVSRKRLAALRKRDPALASRLARIFRLPLWEQPGALAEIQMAHGRRAAETQPDRPGQAAYFAQRALVARSLSLRSVFDHADVGR